MLYCCKNCVLVAGSLKTDSSRKLHAQYCNVRCVGDDVSDCLFRSAAAGGHSECWLSVSDRVADFLSVNESFITLKKSVYPALFVSFYFCKLRISISSLQNTNAFSRVGQERSISLRYSYQLKRWTAKKILVMNALSVKCGSNTYILLETARNSLFSSKVLNHVKDTYCPKT